MGLKPDPKEESLICVDPEVDLLRASLVDSILPLSDGGVKSGDAENSKRNTLSSGGEWPAPIILLL